MAGSGFLMFIVPLVSQRKGTRFKIATYILRLSEAKDHQTNREDRAQRSSTLLAHASGESVDAIDRHIDANNLSLGCQVLKRKRDTHKWYFISEIKPAILNSKQWLNHMWASQIHKYTPILSVYQAQHGQYSVSSNIEIVNRSVRIIPVYTTVHAIGHDRCFNTLLLSLGSYFPFLHCHIKMGCHMCKWVISHVWMRRVTLMNGS